MFPDAKEPEPVGLSVVARYGPPEFPPGSINAGFDGWNNTLLAINDQVNFSVPAGPPNNGRKKLYWGITADNAPEPLEPARLLIFGLRSH